MNYRLVFNTVSHLKTIQIWHQVRYRLSKAKYHHYDAPAHRTISLVTAPIPRYKSLEENSFTFLNLSHRFTDWNFVDNGTLFTYNQNYFDFINAEGITVEEACKWIDRFIGDIPIITWGLDPYPIALRGINWIKFFCRYPECATIEREDSLYSQYRLLEKKLEYHLLGNHLLEDAFSLYIGGCYFEDNKIRNKAFRLLLKQLGEQTLGDGAHYEQSPMYHCILLDRLLDCINVAISCEMAEEASMLKPFAIKQVRWLNSICYKDGSWPFFNDAALGIAPTTIEIINYAKRLGIESNGFMLGDSGYRKFSNDAMEAFVDCGNVTAAYQPGHTHADALNYELHVDGKPFVVDTGISTYDKTPRRQYERSTIAHNCVVPVDCYGTGSSQSSSEVWGGFRVGKRCRVTVIKDEPNEVIASHDGFKQRCERTFKINESSFMIEDRYQGDAISLVHFAENADLGRIKIENAQKIEIIEDEYSIGYNRFKKCQVLKIYFNGLVKYTIR